MTLDVLTQQEIEKKTFLGLLGRKARTFTLALGMSVSPLLPITLTSCDKEEVVPTGYVLESKNSSPDGAVVRAWENGESTKTTIQNNSYSIHNPKSIAYDSITAEKSGFEMFKKGRTVILEPTTLDINLKENGIFTKTFRLSSTNEVFRDKLYSSLHPFLVDIYNKNKPNLEGDTAIWSVKNNNRWERLSQIIIPLSGTITLPLKQGNTKQDTYQLEVKGTNIHPYTQEFTNLDIKNEEPLDVQVAERFYAAFGFQVVFPDKNHSQIPDILVYMQQKNTPAAPEEMIMGLSKGGEVGDNSLSYTFLDITDKEGNLLDIVQKIDGKFTFEAQLGMYLPHIEANPELIPKDYQPNNDLFDVTINNILTQNRIFAEDTGYPDSQSIGMGPKFVDKYRKNISIGIVDAQGTPLENITGEIDHDLFGTMTANKIGNKLTNQGISSLLMDYDSTHHWKPTNYPTVTGKFYQNGVLIAEGTFVGERDAEPTKVEEGHGSLTKTYNTNFTIKLED